MHIRKTSVISFFERRVLATTSGTLERKGILRFGVIFLVASFSTIAFSDRALADLISVTLNPGGTIQSNDLTETIFHSGNDSNGVASRTASGRASVESLGAYLSESVSITPGVLANSDIVLSGTVVFDSDPSISSAIVFWGGDLQGSVSGSGGFVTQINSTLSLHGHTDGFDNSDFGSYSINENLVAGGLVPTNSPVNFSATLRMRIANGQAGNFIEMDFLDSLSFDPNQFFDIQTSGVTANSVNGNWLQNNRLTAIPEPASALLVAFVVSAIAFHRQRHPG